MLGGEWKASQRHREVHWGGSAAHVTSSRGRIGGKEEQGLLCGSTFILELPLNGIDAPEAFGGGVSTVWETPPGVQSSAGVAPRSAPSQGHVGATSVATTLPQPPNLEANGDHIITSMLLQVVFLIGGPWRGKSFLKTPPTILLCTSSNSPAAIRMFLDFFF